MRWLLPGDGDRVPSRAKPWRPRRRLAAVVVPLSATGELGPDEELSLRHLRHHLGAFDKYLLAPAGSTIERDGFLTKRLPRKFFGSVHAHNNLQLWPGLFRAFRQYEFILMHHLDSLVLSNELLRWCRAEFDYIGAPWLPGPDTPWVREPRVGNSGFALIRVEPALQALRNRYRKPRALAAAVADRHTTQLRQVYDAVERVTRFAPASALRARVLAHRERQQDPSRFGTNCDYFWSFQATRFLPSFRIAPPEAGLRFAFETYPRTCLALNGGRLPFGCHAWAKFDRAFWEPYLLPETPHGLV